MCMACCLQTAPSAPSDVTGQYEASCLIACSTNRFEVHPNQTDIPMCWTGDCQRSAAGDARPGIRPFVLQ